MASKKNAGEGGDKKSKKPAPKKRRKQATTVNHAVTARAVQEQLLNDIPQLGYVPESLIETILKLSHKYYIAQGFSSVKLADK